METLAREEGHPSHGLSGRVNVAGRQENKTVWDGGEGFWEGRKGQPEEEENELGGEESENEESEEECEEEREYYGSEDEYYQEGEQPVDGSRMLWLCAICNITVNAFTRNEHIASRSHINASQPTFIELMQCGPLCDEEMPVFLRTDHQLEEEHPRMSQKQWDGDEGRLLALDMPTTPDGDDNGGIRFDETVESYITWPDTPSSPSSSSLYYKLRGTFYCNICAGEFDIFTEGLHSDDGQTWDCALCQKTMHRAVQGMHLLSEQHTKMMDIYETYPASFHCEYCERSYLPADRESHLGGVEHEQMVAQHELAQRY